jgi:hypothetical protein
MYPTAVYDLGQARLADLHRQAQRDTLARAVRLSGSGTRPHTAPSRAGRWLRRLAAALAAVTAGVLAWAASIPAAFARDVPPGLYGRFAVPPGTGHAAAASGVAGWQIALITAGAVLAAAAVTVLFGRARAARRAVPSPVG